MKVALIGSGHIASLHAPAILKQPGAKIVGIADVNISKSKALADQLGVDHYYEDAKVMINEDKPDVVHVLTPPQYHAPLSIMAMNKGCHVLVEKPMALNLDDAQKMISVAKRKKVHLCVDHNLIFTDVIQNVMQKVFEKAIGEIISIEVSYALNARRYPAILEEGAEYCHWAYQLNGGPLQDLIPHPASLIFELIPEIQEIQFVAHNRGVLPKGWQDEIRVLIRSNSLMGYMSISLSEKPDTISLTAKGSKGIVHGDLFSDFLTIRKQSILPRSIARGLSGLELTAQNLKGSLRNIYKFITHRIDRSSGIEPLISNFYKSIRHGGESPIALDKSLRIVELINRIWPVPMTTEDHSCSYAPSPSEKHRGPTVLITGASGFLGTHLIKKLLSEDMRVRALVRPNSLHAGRLKKVDVDIIEGDLTNPEVLYAATKGVKIIYHAGSPTNNSWEEYEQVGIRGTEHLIEAALAHKVRRLVYFSSLAVYELLDNSEKNIKEDSPYQERPKKMGPYAWAKIETEKRVFDAYRREGLGVTVVRPGIVFGPLGRVFFPHLGYRYQDRVFFLIGRGNTILPLTYVENTVGGIYKASTAEKAVGQTYNLVDDGEVTAKSFLETFVKVTGIPARIIQLPYILPYSATTAYEIAAYFGLVKGGLTSRAQLKWKQASVRFDATKAKTELGWEQKFTLQEGMIKTFNYYREASNS